MVYRLYQNDAYGRFYCQKLLWGLNKYQNKLSASRNDNYEISTYTVPNGHLLSCLCIFGVESINITSLSRYSRIEYMLYDDELYRLKSNKINVML